MWKRVAALTSMGCLCAAVATAAPITYTATLSGPAEFPPVESPGTGFVTVIYDPEAHTLDVAAEFSGLVGTTTASHIHCCVAQDAPVPTAGVATPVPSFPGFPAGVTSGTYAMLFDLTLESSWNPSFIMNNGGTTAGAEAALAAGLAAGQAYWNIHSTFSPPGEIRGFLAPATTSVPEPATVSLVGIGVAAMAIGRRRRRTR